MVTFFHDMMHKEIEVYVDDMIGWGWSRGEFEKAIRTIKKIPIEAQPSKMYFCGYILKIARVCGQQEKNQIDPDKVRAIQDLPHPRI